MFQFTNCGMFRAKKFPCTLLYRVSQRVWGLTRGAEGQRQLQRSFAPLLNPSPHLMEVSSLRFSLLLLFHTSSFQIVIIRFQWCVDVKVCGMFVCEIKPIVRRIFLEISAKTIDRNAAFIHMFAWKLKIIRHCWPFLPWCFCLPGRQTPQKNNQTGKMHNSLIYIRAVYKNPVLSGVLVCAWRSTATTARMDGIFSTADFQNKTDRTIW